MRQFDFFISVLLLLSTVNMTHTSSNCACLKLLHFIIGQLMLFMTLTFFIVIKVNLVPFLIVFLFSDHL